jgi:uncharacterized membrane protein YqjE
VSDGASTPPEAGAGAAGPVPAGGPGPAGPGAPSEPVTPVESEAGVATPAENGQRPEEMSVGELVFEISDRASVLVREEIELAKTEVTEKLNRLLRGSVVGLVAGVFVLLALAMIMHGVAWLLNDLLFEDDVWAGFLVEAAVFLVFAGIGGLIAYRSFKRGAPPTPEMAIEEAKEIKATFGSEEGK